MRSIREADPQGELEQDPRPARTGGTCSDQVPFVNSCFLDDPKRVMRVPPYPLVESDRACPIFQGVCYGHRCSHNALASELNLARGGSWSVQLRAGIQHRFTPNLREVSLIK